MTSTITAADFDYHAAEYAKHLMSEAAHAARICALGDTELEEFIDSTWRQSGWNPIEGKWEVNEIAFRDWELHIARTEQVRREDTQLAAAAKARYSFTGPLTHTPFAALAA